LIVTAINIFSKTIPTIQKLGIVKNVEQLVISANWLSTSLTERAVAFYRGYKFTKSFQDWQKKERLHHSIAQTIWDYYKK
jgi:hypothetical protein